VYINFKRTIILSAAIVCMFAFQVVKRSEALGDLEARRVGKLVDRLETLRRGSGSGLGLGIAPPVTTGSFSGARGICRACGKRAPILPILPGLKRCAMCKNFVCSNCVIETGPSRYRPSCVLILFLYGPNQKSRVPVSIIQYPSAVSN